VFKLVTTAAALDLGLVSPDTLWYDSGVLNANGWSIHNWDLSANGTQTVTQILAKSLNTGAAWLAQKLGPDQFYEYVSRFGFGEVTGSGLGGEVAGRVRTPDSDPDWREVDMATNSFGQGIGATPLQMAMAVAALANDGKIMKPMLVKEIIGPDGKSVKPGPQELRQVVKPETARTLLDMMGVVAQGVPPNFLDVQGYTVGGKTGTANVAAEGGGYRDTYISSFAGVVPLEDPQLMIMVKIDEPRGTPWGTVVAAPAFSRIAQSSLAYFKIPPKDDALVAKRED
jgi:cell division protein FtsI/penicillin-binding protein 2